MLDGFAAIQTAVLHWKGRSSFVLGSGEGRGSRELVTSSKSHVNGVFRV